jgi:hypothetical protein
MSGLGAGEEWGVTGMRMSFLLDMMKMFWNYVMVMMYNLVNRPQIIGLYR